MRIFLFLTYSFGIKTINTCSCKYVHALPQFPSKTIPDSRPYFAKCTPLFRPKRRKKPYLMGRHIPIQLGSSPAGKFLVWLKDNMACNCLIPGKSQSIGSNRKLKASLIFLPNFYVRSIEWFSSGVNGALGNVWPDLEISEAFVIGLEVPLSADFTSPS